MIDHGQDLNATTVIKLSPRSVTDTVSRLTSLIHAAGMLLFTVIDQAEQAQRVGLQLRETTLVIFGSPQAGTPIMDAVPLAALDLPLKVLIWAEDEQTKIAYDSPTAFATRHHLSADLAVKIIGIHALTDALVTPAPAHSQDG
jgi:uncharacterized protein (DUF302 family)